MTNTTTPDKPICRNCDAHDHYFKDIAPDSFLSLGGSAWATGKGFRLQICGTCGLTEWFLHEELLPTVRARFSQVK